MAELLDFNIDGFLRGLYKIPLLSSDEERELIHKAQNNDSKARQDMIQANVRLVVSYAKNYKDAPMTLLELVHEGIFGLDRAITKFNPDMGCKFSTYATFWIRTFIDKSIVRVRGPVYIPSHAQEKLDAYCKVFNESTDNEDVDKERLEIFSEEELDLMEDIFRMQQGPFSMQQDIGDSQYTFEEAVLEETCETNEEDILGIRLDIKQAMEVLRPEEVMLISHKFNLEGTEKLNQQELIDKLNENFDKFNKRTGEKTSYNKSSIKTLEREALNKIKAFLVNNGYDHLD